MGKPYSSGLRQRFAAALDEGMSASAAGRRMRIARSTAVRWSATWQREGRAEALPMGGDRRSDALEVHAPQILGWLDATPDLFLSEIVARLAADGVETSMSSIARLLARYGITRKKRLWLLPSRPARTSPMPAPNGGTGWPLWTRQSSSLLTNRRSAQRKRVRHQDDPALRAYGTRGPLRGYCPPRALAQQHVHRRVAK